MESEFSLLIVDDSFLLRSILRKIASMDSRITTIVDAKDGAEALEIVKKREFDFMLVDIEMPVMNGVDFIKRSRPYTDARIILLTSLARDESIDVQKGLFFGAVKAVPKPKGDINKMSLEILEALLGDKYEPSKIRDKSRVELIS